MRFMLLAVGLLGFEVASVAAQTGTSAELERLSIDLFQSMMVARDASLFSRVALEQARVIAPGGVVESKDQAIAGLAAFDVRAVEVDQIEVIVHGDAAAVVGRVVPVGALRGVGPLGPMRFANSFVREQGQWRLLTRSLTPCAERALAAGRC